MNEAGEITYTPVFNLENKQSGSYTCATLHFKLGTPGGSKIRDPGNEVDYDIKTWKN